MPCFLHHCLDVPFSLNLISLCVCLSSFFSAGLKCLRPFGLSAVFTRLFSQLLRDQSQLPFGSVLPASALLNSLHLGSRKLIQSEWLYPSSIIWLMSVKRDGEVGFCGIITEYFCSGSTVLKKKLICIFGLLQEETFPEPAVQLQPHR